MLLRSSNNTQVVFAISLVQTNLILSVKLSLIKSNSLSVTLFSCYTVYLLLLFLFPFSFSSHIRSFCLPPHLHLIFFLHFLLSFSFILPCLSAPTCPSLSFTLSFQPFRFASFHSFFNLHLFISALLLLRFPLHLFVMCSFFTLSFFCFSEPASASLLISFLFVLIPPPLPVFMSFIYMSVPLFCVLPPLLFLFITSISSFFFCPHSLAFYLLMNPLSYFLQFSCPCVYLSVWFPVLFPAFLSGCASSLLCMLS